MNLPNKLTIFRIALVPAMIYFLLCEHIPYHYLIAGAIFALASVTDFFDGQIARRRNLVTDFGKFADPLADKILVISALICFVQLQLVSSVPVIIIIFREFMVTSFRLVAAEQKKVISANIWGKLKTISQIFSIFVVLFSTVSIKLSTIRNIFIWVSVVFTVISGIIYMYENKKFVFAKDKI